MVRTKADCAGAKTSGGKATRKVVAPVKPNAAAAGTSSSNSGGNSYNPQPTPEWQKEITNFFTGKAEKKENEKPSESET